MAPRLPAGWDDHRFSAHLVHAISRLPLTGTAQILVEGEYDGVLEPDRHYLPVRTDLSDLGDVLAQTAASAGSPADRDAGPTTTSASAARYSYRRLAETIDAALRDHGAVRPPSRTPALRIGRRLAVAEAELERRTALVAGAVVRASARLRT